MSTCDHCVAREAGDTTLTWATAVERGRRRWFCPSCSRDHLRAMESKLDSEHW